MKLGFFHRGRVRQTEASKTPGTVSENERKLRVWNEILATIRGTHPRCKGNPQYVMGAETGYGLRYVPVRDMYHCLVTGITGCGKSVWLLSQIIQDILRGDSVFVFDPHGDLAEKILTHIPRERWDDVVYVNPLTAEEHGRVVRYNFLEAKEWEKPSLVKRSFMDALHKNYPEFWGPRLDAIISHAVSLLFKSKETPTLPKLGRALAKETYRNILLSQCKDEDVKTFWLSTFTRYRDDAVTAAQNKLYTILEEEAITPITSAEHSTMDFGRLMQEGKIVIFDIREGALTSSITSFIGTLFLARIYQAGMAREKLPEEKRKYVRVYVDEASRFMTQVLKDNMQALRKYNVFLTVACQNLDQFTEGISSGTRFEGGIAQSTSTVVAFRSSHETAKSLEGFFPKLPADRPEHRHEHLERARLYHFYLSTVVGTKLENYYVKSIDPGLGENKLEEVIAHSLKIHGERYDVYAKRRVLELPDFEFGPAAYFAMSELEDRGEISEESLQEKLKKFAKTAVTDALFKTLKDRGWATFKKKEGTAKTMQRFWRITDAGIEMLYPTTKITGNRLGGAKHIAMLCLACRLYREMEYFPMLISGKREYDTVTIQEGERKVDIYPDILLLPSYSETSTRYAPGAWDVSRAVAVEIEAYPTGGKYTGAHLDRTKAHFVKARDMLEMPVIFVVQTEREAEAVRRAIKEEGARIVPDVHTQYEPGNATVRVLGRELEEAENISTVLDAQGKAPTALGMQIKKLCAMSREANISRIGEPEDFMGETVPDYADHRWLEEVERKEAEAERKVAEEIEAERKKAQLARETKIEDIIETEKTKPPEEQVTGEKKEKKGKLEEREDDRTQELVKQEMKRLRKQRIEPLKEDGWIFWKEETRGHLHLYAGKVQNGEPERIHVDFLDDATEEVLSELGIFLELCQPEQFKPRLNLPAQKAKEEGIKPIAPPEAKLSEEQVTGKEKKEKPSVQPTPLEQLRAPLPRPMQPERQETSLPSPTQPRRPETSPLHPTQPEQPKQPETPSEPSKDRESKVVELKQEGARWYENEISGKRYVRACTWIEGRRKYTSLGLFDEELKQIFKKHNILLQ